MLKREFLLLLLLLLLILILLLDLDLDLDFFSKKKIPGLVKAGLAYYFIDLPLDPAVPAKELYSGIYADAAFHAWGGGAAIDPFDPDAAFFVAMIATVPGYIPVKYPFASFIGALQLGVWVVSTKALVSGYDGQLLRTTANSILRTGDYRLRNFFFL